MAQNKEFVYTVKVQVKDENGEPVEKSITKTAKSIKDFEEGINSLKTKLNETELNSDEFKKLNKELKDAEGNFEAAKMKSQGLGESLGQIPGPIGQVAQGVKGLGTAFKALIANPVGLILAAIALALTTLYKAFTSTKAGAEKMEQVFSALGAVVDVIRDRFLQLVKALASFDIKGIIESFTGFGDEVKREAQEAANLTKKLQELDDQERELSKNRAETNKEIAKAKLLINDENLSYEERQKALEQVRTAEIALAEQEQKLAQDRYDAIVAQNAQSDSSKEALDAEAQAYVTLQNAQMATAQKQKELFDQEKALRDRQRAEAKAAAQEAKANREALLAFEQKINQELILDETERARKQLDIDYQTTLKEINDLKTSTKKKNELRLKAEEDYQNKIDKFEEEQAQKQTEKEIKEIDNQITLLNIQGEQELEALKTLLDAKMELELQALNLTESEKAVIRKKYNEEYLAQEEAVNKKKEEAEQKNKDQQQKDADDAARLRDQEYAQINQGLTDFITVVGEKSKLGKSAAIAQALINAYKAVSEVLAAESVLPEPFGSIQKGISSAAIFTSAMAQVNAIKQIDQPKLAMGGVIQGRGTGTSDSITARVSNGESVINSKSTSMFLPLLSAINQYGGGAAFDTTDLSAPSQSNTASLPPIKTYVVSRDITNQQELDIATKYASTL